MVFFSFHIIVSQRTVSVCSITYYQWVIFNWIICIHYLWFVTDTLGCVLLSSRNPREGLEIVTVTATPLLPTYHLSNCPAAYRLGIFLCKWKTITSERKWNIIELCRHSKIYFIIYSMLIYLLYNLNFEAFEVKNWKISIFPLNADNSQLLPRRHQSLD